MKRIILMALATTMAVLAIPVMADDDSDSDGDSDSDRRGRGSAICDRTADKMFQSCRFEVNEEFFATNAKCINFGDADERNVCMDVAREIRQDDKRGCGEQREARQEVCELLDENRFDPEALLNTDNFVAEPDDANPYFSLQPGHTYVARAGENFEETIVVTVTDEVREILGVNCRIVVDIVLLNEGGEYEAVEVTDDYYALALNGDVHYCGEVARNFEDGALHDLDGSFEAGRDYAKSGILIKAAPGAGDGHRQEYLPGEAEDVIRYVAGAGNPTSVGPGEGGENTLFPCNGMCIKTEEFIPTEPGAGEFKYFMAGTGFVLGVGLEDGEPTGERDELLCVGEGLEATLANPDCGLTDDLPELLNLLCELSPIAFCVD